MLCSSCGTANQKDSKFCKECGQKLETATSAKTLTPQQHIRIGELVYAAYKHKEAGSIDEAILACLGALALNNTSAPTHAFLGSLYEAKGDIASAIYEYETAVMLNPAAVADRQKLDDLKRGRTTPSRIAIASNYWLSTLKPFAPHISAGFAGICILILGLMLIRSSSGKPGPADIEQQARASDNQTVMIQPSPLAQPFTQAQRYPKQPADSGHRPRIDQEEEEERLPSSPGLPGPRQTTSPKQQQPRQLASLPSVRQPTPNQTRSNVRAQAIRSSSSQQSPIVPVYEVPTRTARPAGQSGTNTASQASISAIAPVQPPADPEGRAIDLQRTGQYQEAISAYREALGHTSDSGRIYQQIALSYQRLGKHDMAIDSYNRAINSYREQLSAGRDAEEVQRNIRACEDGIKVSQNR